MPDENPIPTISGQLYFNQTDLFARTKYQLKRNENKYRNNQKFYLIIGAVVAICIVLTFAVTYKIIDRFGINEKTKTSEMKQSIRLENETTITTYPEIHFGCVAECETHEICFQNATKSKPECLQIKDATDPTGCGGLCQLQTQYCKQLSKTIHSCIDIETILCTKQQWKCAHTLVCIEIKQKCDGIIHCADKTDEINCKCDLRTHFQCNNNISCLPNWKKCNGSVECWDASDEINCTHECGSLKIPCYNGQCIKTEQYCDGMFDCQDKSDEPIGCNKT